MSQPPKRKGVAVVSGAESRRGSLPKTTANKPPAAPDTKVTNNNKSKNKIPKNIRYDLQNALVSLCDVWFEEIKPHLVRNNIKLHTHEQKPQASGDFEKLPPEALGCSHLDPGAAPDHYRQRTVNFADYCLTQPTASRAQYPKPRAASRYTALPLLPSLPTNPQISSHTISYTLLATPQLPQPIHLKDKSTQTDFPLCNNKKASITPAVAPKARKPLECFPQNKKTRDSCLSSPLFQEVREEFILID